MKHDKFLYKLICGSRELKENICIHCDYSLKMNGALIICDYLKITGKRRPCCSAECIQSGVFRLKKGHKMPENMDFMSNLRVKIPYPIKFGTKIESLRNGKGMKARHAAKLIGHEPAWLRNIERGLAASININDLEKIAEIYGENADALLKWGWNEKIGEEKAPADNIQGVAESGKARPVRDRKGRKPGRSGTSNRGKDGKTP